MGSDDSTFQSIQPIIIEMHTSRIAHEQSILSKHIKTDYKLCQSSRTIIVLSDTATAQIFRYLHLVNSGKWR